jgi:hypothetical protein
VRAILLLVVLSAVAHAEPKVRAYRLFDPVPDREMRALAYGMTPYTVDAGHVQVEVNVANSAWDASDGEMTQLTSLGAFELKLGLTNTLDAEVMIAPWLHFSRPGLELSGVGDTSLRVKLNVYGNDGGDFALALVPYVTLPTGQDLGTGDLQTGMIVPMTHSLPFEVAGMLAIAINNDVQVTTTATLSRIVTGPVSGFFENIATVSADDDPQLTTHVGATIGGLDHEIDTGIMFDPMAPTQRYNPYIALTVRR